MENPSNTLQKGRKNKIGIIRWLAIILMVCLFVFLIVAYKDIKEYNKLPKDPCSLCEEINDNVKCIQVMENADVVAIVDNIDLGFLDENTN